jgi:hypothetical protein
MGYADPSSCSVSSYCPDNIPRFNQLFDCLTEDVFVPGII